MTLNSLIWKLNRLRAMDGPEIVHRIRQTIQTRLEHAGIGLAKSPRESHCTTSSRAWVDPLPRRVESAPYLRAADRIIGGRFKVFSIENAQLGFPPKWNRNPKDGIVAPLSHGISLDYRNKEIVGDIKYLWEPNRHLELVTLAQAFFLSGDARYAMAARALIESWIEQCPYPYGPNWTSTLELAVRLTNWSVAWHLLGGDSSKFMQEPVGKSFRERWLRSIYQHSHFIAGHLSLHSSANNHLFGEYMGLFIASITWPCWAESIKWRDMARTGLEEEIQKQVGPDGVNQEQATWYHHEVADMALLCAIFGRANDVDLSARFWNWIEKMLDFIASIMDCRGHVPAFGDSDDAVMVRFSQEPNFDVYHSLLATGAVLFKRPDFLLKAEEFDDKSHWLLGDIARDQLDNLREQGPRLPVRQAFRNGGYYLLGDAWETDREIRIVAQAGPLGYLSIAAHGHADALSFTLSVCGHEFLVDPGTYAYHSDKLWRNYFRGTSAHNTLRVDEQDQSVSGGTFLWLRHAKAWCESFTTDTKWDEWTACHDGYLRLKQPVVHKRSVSFDKPARTIIVNDVLDGSGMHKVEIMWHFSESCNVHLENGRLTAETGGSSIHVTGPGILAVHLARGEHNPPLGWISRSFDTKIPTYTAYWEGQVSAGTILQTKIECNPCRRSSHETPAAGCRPDKRSQ